MKVEYLIDIGIFLGDIFRYRVDMSNYEKEGKA